MSHSSKLTPEERAKKNAYANAWYHAHKDEISARRKELYQINRPKIRQAQAIYYQNNSEKLKEHVRQWRKNDPENAKACDHRKYMKHRDKILAREAAAYAANPEPKRESAKRYRNEHAHDTAICAACHKPFTKEYYSSELCSDCLEKRRNTLHAYDTKYQKIQVNGKSQPLHREVLKQVGLLTPEFEDYDVHHINGCKDDNVPDNLLIISKPDHPRLHRLLETEWINHPDMTMEELTEIVIHKYHFDYL